MIATDILVIGAGSAGVAAATAAAREGCSVICVDRNPYPGGCATASMVGTICGTFFRGPTCEWAVAGFARDFPEAVGDASKTQPMMFDKNLWFLPYDPDCFKQVAERFMHEAHVDMWTQTSFLKWEKTEAGIAVTVNREHEAQPILAKRVIDCSGTTTFTTSDEGRLKEKERQTGALVARVMGLPPEAEGRHITLTLLKEVARLIAAEQLPGEVRRLSLVPGSLKQGQALLKLGLPAGATYEASVTLLKNVVTQLRSATPLFSSLSWVEAADELGERSGHRYAGRDRLSVEDVLTCRKPEHGIACGTWPIEFWKENPKPEMEYLPEHEQYLITAECLYSPHFSWLFFAGKNISAEERALGSARVMGTCMQTGVAAGMLAAAACKDMGMDEMVLKIRKHQLGL